MAPAANPGQTLSPRSPESTTAARHNSPTTASSAAVPVRIRRRGEPSGAVRCGVLPGEGVLVSMGFNANSGNGAVQRLGTGEGLPGRDILKGTDFPVVSLP